MNKKVLPRKMVVFLVSILVIVEICTLFLMYKSSNNKMAKLSEVNLSEEGNDDLFAIMLEQSDGSYTASKTNTWPSDYFYNSAKSGCVDNEGNKLEGGLSYDNATKIATVDTSNTAYCYLYFNKNDTLTPSSLVTKKVDNLSTTSVAGMYRFQDTAEQVTNNYICLSNETCDYLSDDMYRIIGISGNQMKVIKNTSAGSTTWEQENTGYMGSQVWSELSNADMMINELQKYTELEEYFQPAFWGGTIEESVWQSKNGIEVQKKEPNGAGFFNSFGLMNVSDYYLSLNNETNCHLNGAACKESWLHLSNNGDSNTETLAEYTAWNSIPYGTLTPDPVIIIYSDGTASKGPEYVNSAYFEYRPVGFLKDTITFKGIGTKDNPYVIQ